jgi:O-antigen ligase
MFSNVLDRAGCPRSERRWGIVLGSLLAVAVAAAIVSARTQPFMLTLVVAGFLGAAAVRGNLQSAIPRRSSVALHLALLLFYALASAAWGLDPPGTLLAVALAMLVALGTIALMQLFVEEPLGNLLHMGEGVWAAYVVGLLYLLIELASDQGIKLWLYNQIGLSQLDLSHPGMYEWSSGRLVAISDEEIKRNIAPLTLFLWPAVLAALGTFTRDRGLAVATAIVALAGTVVMLATHGTSKLAFAGALLVFALASFAPRLTGRAIVAGWVVVCVAVLPAALIAHRLDLHNAAWLEPSTRHRIIIWNYTAEQVLSAPWLGVGARTTYVLGPRLERTLPAPPDEQALASFGIRRTLSTHSHSVYLQTWFELGLVGATLLTLLGLAILQAIRGLAVPLQRYAYATFASAAIMAASSYGMWQIWFIAMFGLCAALFALGAALNCKRDRTANLSA